MNLSLILRALNTHEKVLKQAIILSLDAQRQIQEHPYRSPDPRLRAKVLDDLSMKEIEDELSNLALTRLEVQVRI